MMRKAILICHENDRFDREGLAAWMAVSFHLVGIVELRDDSAMLLKKLRREYKRVGFLRLVDVLLFRLFYRVFLASKDSAWIKSATNEMCRRYPVDLSTTPVMVSHDPNSAQVEEFIRHHSPDFLLARCKFILRPEIFNIPRYGTFVLHPGICPEYRNAHGCFWALARRDMGRVGMTLLKVDAGVDTGAVYMQATSAFDEVRDSHIVIQYRMVMDNLENIRQCLDDICAGQARADTSRGRQSRCWGQPWLSAYLFWKHAARNATA